MSPILTGVIASGISGNLTPPWEPQGAYDALVSTTVGAGGTASVTFENIPDGYKHLQIRALMKTSSASPDMLMQFNGDTSNYNFHILRGNSNAVVTSERYVNSSIANPVSDVFQPAIIDVFDYSSTVKNKTSRIFVGRDNNGAGDVGIWSQLWYATPQAITSIRFIPTTGNIAQHSTFAVYGVK